MSSRLRILCRAVLFILLNLITKVVPNEDWNKVSSTGANHMVVVQNEPHSPNKVRSSPPDRQRLNWSGAETVAQISRQRVKKGGLLGNVLGGGNGRRQKQRAPTLLNPAGEIRLPVNNLVQNVMTPVLVENEEHEASILFPEEPVVLRQYLKKEFAHPRTRTRVSSSRKNTFEQQHVQSQHFSLKNLNVEFGKEPASGFGGDHLRSPLSPTPEETILKKPRVQMHDDLARHEAGLTENDDEKHQPAVSKLDAPEITTPTKTAPSRAKTKKESDYEEYEDEGRGEDKSEGNAIQKTKYVKQIQLKVQAVFEVPLHNSYFGSTTSEKSTLKIEQVPKLDSNEATKSPSHSTTHSPLTPETVTASLPRSSNINPVSLDGTGTSRTVTPKTSPNATIEHHVKTSFPRRSKSSVLTLEQVRRIEEFLKAMSNSETHAASSRSLPKATTPLSSVAKGKVKKGSTTSVSSDRDTAATSKPTLAQQNENTSKTAELLENSTVFTSPPEIKNKKSTMATTTTKSLPTTPPTSLFVSSTELFKFTTSLTTMHVGTPTCSLTNPTTQRSLTFSPDVSSKQTKTSSQSSTMKFDTFTSPLLSSTPKPESEPQVETNTQSTTVKLQPTATPSTATENGAKTKAEKISSPFTTKTTKMPSSSTGTGTAVVDNNWKEIQTQANTTVTTKPLVSYTVSSPTTPTLKTESDRGLRSTQKGTKTNSRSSKETPSTLINKDIGIKSERTSKLITKLESARTNPVETRHVVKTSLKTTPSITTQHDSGRHIEKCSNAHKLSETEIENDKKFETSRPSLLLTNEFQIEPSATKTILSVGSTRSVSTTALPVTTKVETMKSTSTATSTPIPIQTSRYFTTSSPDTHKPTLGETQRDTTTPTLTSQVSMNKESHSTFETLPVLSPETEAPNKISTAFETPVRIPSAASKTEKPKEQMSSELSELRTATLPSPSFTATRTETSQVSSTHKQTTMHLNPSAALATLSNFLEPEDNSNKISSKTGEFRTTSFANRAETTSVFNEMKETPSLILTKTSEFTNPTFATPSEHLSVATEKDGTPTKVWSETSTLETSAKAPSVTPEPQEISNGMSSTKSRLSTSTFKTPVETPSVTHESKETRNKISSSTNEFEVSTFAVRAETRPVTPETKKILEKITSGRSELRSNTFGISSHEPAVDHELKEASTTISSKGSQFRSSTSAPATFTVTSETYATRGGTTSVSSPNEKMTVNVKSEPETTFPTLSVAHQPRGIPEKFSSKMREFETTIFAENAAKVEETRNKISSFSSELRTSTLPPPSLTVNIMETTQLSSANKQGMVNLKLESTNATLSMSSLPPSLIPISSDAPKEKIETTTLTMFGDDGFWDVPLKVTDKTINIQRTKNDKQSAEPTNIPIPTPAHFSFTSSRHTFLLNQGVATSHPYPSTFTTSFPRSAGSSSSSISYESALSDYGKILKARKPAISAADGDRAALRQSGVQMMNMADSDNDSNYMPNTTLNPNQRVETTTPTSQPSNEDQLLEFPPPGPVAFVRDQPFWQFPEKTTPVLSLWRNTKKKVKLKGPKSANTRDSENGGAKNGKSALSPVALLPIPSNNPSTIQDHDPIGPHNEPVLVNNPISQDNDQTLANNKVGPIQGQVSSNNPLGPISDQVSANNPVGQVNDQVSSNNPIGLSSDQILEKNPARLVNNLVSANNTVDPVHNPANNPVPVQAPALFSNTIGPVNDKTPASDPSPSNPVPANHPVHNNSQNTTAVQNGEVLSTAPNVLEQHYHEPHPDDRFLLEGHDFRNSRSHAGENFDNEESEDWLERMVRPVTPIEVIENVELTERCV